jgi:hypothetical protein
VEIGHELRALMLLAFFKLTRLERRCERSSGFAQFVSNPAGAGRKHKAREKAGHERPRFTQRADAVPQFRLLRRGFRLLFWGNRR